MVALAALVLREAILAAAHACLAWAEFACALLSASARILASLTSVSARIFATVRRRFSSSSSCASSSSSREKDSSSLSDGATLVTSSDSLE